MARGPSPRRRRPITPEQRHSALRREQPPSSASTSSSSSRRSTCGPRSPAIAGDLRGVLQTASTSTTGDPALRRRREQPVPACCERYGDDPRDDRAVLPRPTRCCCTPCSCTGSTRPQTPRGVCAACATSTRHPSSRCVCQNMPKLIAEVDEFMHSGDLDALGTFNQNQVADERAKQELLAQHPECAPAVDAPGGPHDPARNAGSVRSGRARSQRRAAAFEAVFDPEHWPVLTGALLAIGEYQRDYAGLRPPPLRLPDHRGRVAALLVDRGDRGVTRDRRARARRAFSTAWRRPPRPVEGTSRPIVRRIPRGPGRPVRARLALLPGALPVRCARATRASTTARTDGSATR